MRGEAATSLTLPTAAREEMRYPDDARFSALLATYAPSLRRLCASYVTDVAEREDLMQEIAFALWRGLATFRGECSERTFVYRIAQNRALSFRFRKRLPRAPLAMAESVEDPSARTDATAEQASERERLLRAVRALSEGQREVVVLRLEGLGDREIGEVLGISEGTVAVRLTRARQALRLTLMGSERSDTTTHDPREPR